MRDFWLSSGYRLLDRDESGWLRVTDDFLRAYLTRPELAPVAESCAAEKSLHEDLLADPRRKVSRARIDAIAAADARENYAFLMTFRDLLVEAGTIENAYMSVFRGDGTALPALFLDQMAHVILRNLLDGCADPLRVRAAELLFRPQQVTIDSESIMVADQEIIAMRAARDDRTGVVQFEHIGQLLGETGPAGRTVELDVLDAENADLYWSRSDRFDTVLDIGFTAPGLDALCRVLESWVRHCLGVSITVYPVQAIRDERWIWHVGLDTEATAMLNDLYAGVPLSEERNYRLLTLFRCEFADPAVMIERVRGRPVYMGMAMTAGGILRLKPQNLIVNLPLAAAA